MKMVTLFTTPHLHHPDSEEFTTGYGDLSEIDGEETFATKKREPLTDKDGDIIYGNDGQPVYPTEQANRQKKECLSPMKTVTLFTVTTVYPFTAQRKSNKPAYHTSNNSLEKQIENKISENHQTIKCITFQQTMQKKSKKYLTIKKLQTILSKASTDANKVIL